MKQSPLAIGITLSLAITVLLSHMIASASSFSGSDPQFLACKAKEDGVPGEKGERFEKLKNELGLTPEQAEAMKAKKEAFREAHKADFETMKTKMKEFRELKQSNGDPEKLESLKKELAQMRQSLQEKRRNQFKSILTPEQLEKWDQLKKEHQGKSRGHKGESTGE